MKNYYLLMMMLLFIGAELSAQDCKDVFSKNITVGSRQSIETKSMILHTQTDFDYEVVILVGEEGITARLTSTDAARPLEKDTKIMFVADDNDKKVFSFIQEGVKINVRNRSGYTNVLQLDMAALDWFASKNMKSLRVVDMIENKI